MKGRKKKGKWDDLDMEWKMAVASAKDDDIHTRLKDLALGRSALLDARSKDQQLKEAKEAASQAGEVYRDGLKGNAMRVAYIREVLESRGKDGDGDFEKQ